MLRQPAATNPRDVSRSSTNLQLTGVRVATKRTRELAMLGRPGTHDIHWTLIPEQTR